MSSDRSGSIDAHIGGRLRARRQHLKLTQADLARALQVSVQQVHKYETAKSSLPAANLLALSRALRVKPAFFFSGLEDEALASAPARPRKRAL